ncbi:MAG TPA: thiamine pyrophosphate-binding protein [Thermoanaerobaculia bacterium]|jgi:acetolactate synthase-1/2/3 large subunit
MTGGDLVADVLARRGVKFLFTLCGGHISPILVSARRRGIRVIDVRDEAAAAFAADAVSRLTGTPGVAAVTAGPGVTNTLTAVKNAQLAQSPLVLLGGATGTILKGRGSLQDIDQVALFEPHVKWLAAVERVRELAPAVEEGFDWARLGVPGPVFVECPVDLLYEEGLVRKLYGVGEGATPPRSLAERATRWYLGRHLARTFRGAGKARAREPREVAAVRAEGRQVRRVHADLARAERPVALVGSQALLRTAAAQELAAALDRLGIPVYLSGMARGLLGAAHPLLLRHQRRQALKEADLVLLAGVPCDFRLDYGRHVSRKARLLAVNLSDQDLTRNRRPDRGVLADPGAFLADLAAGAADHRDRWRDWLDALRRRDAEREKEIDARAARETDHVNPLYLCREIDRALDEDSVLVADGGDFVATASYTVRPRGPLRWLDPGVFGTLGVGGGFALGAKLVRPESEVWLLYGDGSAAYSIAEFDTFVRHGLPVIAVVGNDAGWTQIAREQVEILGDDCGTVLRHTDYHTVAAGYGGRGLRVDRPEDVPGVLREAKEIARGGTPVLVNALIGKTDFRKGSISM